MLRVKTKSYPQISQYHLGILGEQNLIHKNVPDLPNNVSLMLRLKAIKTYHYTIFGM
jgi:hypothetical protein